MSGFVTRLAASASAHVIDLRVTLNGEPRYFIIRLKPTHIQAFHDAVNQNKGFTVEDYGIILHRGYGEPTEHEKADWRVQYGLTYL